MKTRLCIVLSDVDTSHLIESMGRSLDANKYEVSFVFLGASVPSLFHNLQASGYFVKFIKCGAKRDYVPAMLQMRRVIRDIKPDIVHTHLVKASVIGLGAAKLCSVKKRIHTRHHSVETHYDYPHGVYYDRLINAMSTHIVAISPVVRDVLIEKENVDPAKISLVRHGFDLARFQADASLVDQLKEKYELTGRYPVVGVISRHIHWKGVQYIVPAFQELVKKFPQAKLVLANATGPYQAEIKRLLANLDPSQYVLIEFEKNIFALYQTFDVFVHVPVGREYEAFGQVYVEALAVGVPSVFSLSGIATDFIEHRRNALVVPYRDSPAILAAIELLLNDAELKTSLIENGRSVVRELFQERKMAEGLDEVYSKES